jgi:membrane protein YdbS with pleckstrin-like domain
MQTDALDAVPPAVPPPIASPAPEGWQPLPRRARALMMLGMAAMCLPAVPAAAILAAATDVLPTAVVACSVLAVALAFGLWRGARQYACLAWRLDAEGLAVRRGTLWESETRVPASRVQHLDIKRGPLQRRRDLSTLVVHTAGTRLSTVSVPHLDAGDAERLRDALSRQVHDVDD